MEKQRQRNVFTHATIAWTATGASQIGNLLEGAIAKIVVVAFYRSITSITAQKLFAIDPLDPPPKYDAKDNLGARLVRCFEHLALPGNTKRLTHLIKTKAQRDCDLQHLNITLLKATMRIG